LRIALLVALGFCAVACRRHADPPPAPKASAAAVPPPTDDAIRKDAEQFEHRKRYATLTTQVLATIPDDQLELAILDWIDSKIAGDYQHAHAIVGRLSPGMRMLYATWWLESEVDNGGFNQFFWNSSGQFAQDALDGFKLLHADELANLTGAAIAIAQREAPLRQKFQAQGTIEAFSESYKHTSLDELDKQFYKLDDGLSKRRVAYVRAHPEQFTTR
jgi:hypothetical protein